MKLEELRIYQLAMEIGKIVWEQVQKWKVFLCQRHLYEIKRLSNSDITREVLYMKQRLG